MDEAVEHYNCNADLEKAITVDYNPGVSTAEASEHQSEWSLINHVRIVAAMQQDKQAYLNGEL